LEVLEEFGVQFFEGNNPPIGGLNQWIWIRKVSAWPKRVNLKRIESAYRRGKCRINGIFTTKCTKVTKDGLLNIYKTTQKNDEREEQNE
jgi:hypothetical protein